MKKIFIFLVNFICMISIPYIVKYFQNKYGFSFGTYFIIAFALIMTVTYFIRKLTDAK